MRRLLGLVLLLAAIASVVGYVYYDRSQRALQERRQSEARQAAVTARLSDFAKITHSSTDWERGGGAKADRSLDNMLTVDLERAWLSGRPILFVGAVSDVSTIDERTYRIFVEYRPDWDTLLLSKKLWLEVECVTEKVQPVLEVLRRSERRTFGGPGLAVAVHITRVRRETLQGESDKTVLTGVGSCVDLLYIDNLSDAGR